MLYLKFTAVTNFLCAALVAVIVLYRCERRDLAVRYGLLNLCIMVFYVFYYGWQNNPSVDSAYSNLRALMMIALWINHFFLDFVLHFLGITSFRRKLLRFDSVVCAFFTWLAWKGILFSSIEPRFGWGYWGNIKPLFSLYVIYWHLGPAFAFQALLKVLRTSTGLRRNQMRYLLLAFGIGYLGATSNWPMWFKIDFPPYGNGLISLYCLVMTYAIFRHQVLDIQLVIKKTLIYSMVSASLIAVYVTTVTLIARLMEGHVVSSPVYSSAIAAGIITLLFDPLRNRIQAFIDRRFFRTQIDRAEKLAEFSSYITEEGDLEKMTGTLCRLLAEAFHPKHLAVYVKEDDQADMRRLYQEGDVSLPEGLPLTHTLGSRSPLIIPLASRGNVLGCVLLGEKRSEEVYSDDDMTLLRLVCNQAALAFERPKLLREASDGLVHEIKTPMANIVLPAELMCVQIQDALKQKSFSPELLPSVHKRLKYIMEQALLAGQRVDALQEMNELTNREFKPVELNELIQTSLAELNEFLETHHVQATLALDEALPGIKGNAGQLKIVLVNLFRNAAEAMGQNAESERHLSIRSAALERGAEVFVEDTGPGVPASMRELIFQSHYSTKNRAGGVGLFLVRQIIKAHGGSVTAEEVRSGACFRIMLPMVESMES